MKQNNYHFLIFQSQIWLNDCLSVRKEAGWSDDQPSLETVKSVDELLELLYPEYGLLQQCLRRKAHRSALAASYPSFPDPSASPLIYSDDEDVWAHSRKEALYKMDGTLEGKSNHSRRLLQMSFFGGIRLGSKGFQLFI